MNKKYLTGIIASVLLISLVAAAYVVSTLNVQVDVKETFSNVEFAVVASGTDCSTLTDADYDPATTQTITGGLIPGESRKACVRFDSETAEEYNFKDTVTCYNAIGNVIGVPVFDTTSVEGVTSIVGTNYNGIELTVRDDAPPTRQGSNDGCTISIELSRGTL